MWMKQTIYPNIRQTKSFNLFPITPLPEVYNNTDGGLLVFTDDIDDEKIGYLVVDQTPCWLKNGKH